VGEIPICTWGSRDDSGVAADPSHWQSTAGGFAAVAKASGNARRRPHQARTRPMNLRRVLGSDMLTSCRWLGMGLGGAAQHRPVHIRAQVFAADGALGGAFDFRAPF